MMVRYAPFTSALGDKHGEARWSRYRFALYHPGKCVKAGDFVVFQRLREKIKRKPVTSHHPAEAASDADH
jgi:hypothetical protein